MPDTKMGKLDHPERYGRRSMAVYSNSNGLYFIHDGIREDVHGNQLWTTLSNVKMRGESPVAYAPANVAALGAPPADAAPGELFDREDIDAAIAASLEDSPYNDSNNNEMQIDSPVPPVVDDGNADSVNRTCLICLTDPAVMLMRPCNHLAACQSCSRRLLRNPCVVCRRNVSSIERIF